MTARRLPPPDARLLSIREVARRWRLSRETIARDVKAKRLPAKVRGRAIMCSAKRAEELYGVES